MLISFIHDVLNTFDTPNTSIHLITSHSVTMSHSALQTAQSCPVHACWNSHRARVCVSHRRLRWGRVEGRPGSRGFRLRIYAPLHIDINFYSVQSCRRITCTNFKWQYTHTHTSVIVCLSFWHGERTCVNIPHSRTHPRIAFNIADAHAHARMYALARAQLRVRWLINNYTDLLMRH